MKKIFKRVICILISVITVISTCCFIPAFAETEAKETVETVEVKGFQRIDKDDGTFSLRVVAGLSSSEIDDFGMVVKCKDNAGLALRFDIKGEKKLSEIFETVNALRPLVNTSFIPVTAAAPHSRAAAAPAAERCQAPAEAPAVAVRAGLARAAG